MRSCFICMKIDVLHNMNLMFEDLELIKNINYFANISIVELENTPLLICKNCEKYVLICANFKRKCLLADENAKKLSNERYVWIENLNNLRRHPNQSNEESTTIETVMNEPPLDIPQSLLPDNLDIDSEPEPDQFFDATDEPDPEPQINVHPQILQSNGHSNKLEFNLKIIDNLSYEDLKVITENDIVSLLAKVIEPPKTVEKTTKRRRIK